MLEAMKTGALIRAACGMGAILGQATGRRAQGAGFLRLCARPGLPDRRRPARSRRRPETSARKPKRTPPPARRLSSASSASTARGRGLRRWSAPRRRRSTEFGDEAATLARGRAFRRRTAGLKQIAKPRKRMHARRLPKIFRILHARPEAHHFHPARHRRGRCCCPRNGG